MYTYIHTRNYLPLYIFNVNYVSVLFNSPPKVSVHCLFLLKLWNMMN